MAKLNREDLQELRKSIKKDIEKRKKEDKTTQIIVGIGSCGIAAGAEETMTEFIKALEERHITNAIVKQTGCMGLCYAEPTVEVIVDGMPDIIYGNVDPTIARAIVDRHIRRGELINDHIFDRPAGDILRSKEAR